jgi:hypothetical protein
VAVCTEHNDISDSAIEVLERVEWDRCEAKSRGDSRFRLSCCTLFEVGRTGLEEEFLLEFLTDSEEIISSDSFETSVDWFSNSTIWIRRPHWMHISLLEGEQGSVKIHSLQLACPHFSSGYDPIFRQRSHLSAGIHNTCILNNSASRKHEL